MSPNYCRPATGTASANCHPGTRTKMSDGPWSSSVVLSDTGGVRQVLCPVLVGRNEEVRHLEAALAAAGAGRGGVVLITGEAGIGKSRLAREAARAAGALGLVELTGRAVASDVPTPFRPFAEALASAGRAGRLPDGSELDPFRPALGRLVPEWRQPRQMAGDESLAAAVAVTVAVSCWSWPRLLGLPGAVTAPCPAQAPPPNPIAADPDGRRVLSRGGVADHE
jgi:AAA ATPase domain